MIRLYYTWKFLRISYNVPLLFAGGIASLRLGKFWRSWLADSSVLSCAVWWSFTIWLRLDLRAFCCRSSDSNKSSLIDNFRSTKFTPRSKLLNISGICFFKNIRSELRLTVSTSFKCLSTRLRRSDRRFLSLWSDARKALRTILWNPKEEASKT